MRKIKKPILDPGVVFGMCIDKIENQALKNKMKGIATNIMTEAINYDNIAKRLELFKMVAFQGKNADIVLNDISKGELKTLYSYYMVNSAKPARFIYDKLRSSSVDKLCPTCGFGQVKTLDHYLPKSKFPLYSVLPYNLIPACRDCNTEKLASTVNSAEMQTIHPYYDSNHFFDEQWLFARLECTTPPTVVFFVDAPLHWDPISKKRVVSHFKEFNLSERFSVAVSTQLAAISDYLVILSDDLARQKHLLETAGIYHNAHRNSWQTALTQALANSHWYWREGYKRKEVESVNEHITLGAKAQKAHPRYCLRCERELDSKESSLQLCKYHSNSEINETEIPEYKGSIPNGSICMGKECGETATKIFAGTCFCAYHFAEAKDDMHSR
jgi:hypothetical protein